MSKRYWKGSDLKIAVELTDKKGNPIAFANVDELTIYLKTTGDEYVKVSKGSGIESDADGNIYVRLNEHSLDNLPDGLLRYDARWKISAEGWDNGYDTVQSCETDIFVKTPDNYVPKANVQEKSVTYTANGDYVLEPDGSYEGISKANIKVELPMESKSVTYTANGDYSVVPSDGYEGLQDVSIHIEIDLSPAYKEGIMKFLRKETLGKLELPKEAMDTPYCLYGQTGVTEVVVPEGCKYIPEGFFGDCTSLEKITYPDTVERFDSNIYKNISYDKINSFSLPPYLNNSLEGNIYYKDGEVFNVPKYINQTGSYSSPSFVSYYNDGVAEKIIFGNIWQIRWNQIRAKELDFSHNVQIPTFYSTSPYTGMTKVIVPESLYDTWITTSPWSNYADITEAVADIDYPVPYETFSKDDLTLTVGVKDNRYAVVSCTDKRIVFRGTPWNINDLLNNSDITYIDFSNIELPSYEGLLRNCKSLTDVIYPSNIPLYTIGTFEGCSSLESIPPLDTHLVTDMRQMFHGCSSLESIPPLDTHLVTDMTDLFNGCSNIQTIPSLDTISCQRMQSMFEGCTSLIEVPEMDTSNCIYFNNMLKNCKSLVNIPFLNICKGTNTIEMFNGCSSLESIPPLDTHLVTDANNMFRECSSLETIQSIDMSNALNIQCIFYNDGKLKKIPILYLPKCTEMTEAFVGCSLLDSIDIDTGDSSRYIHCERTFMNLTQQTRIKVKWAGYSAPRIWQYYRGNKIDLTEWSMPYLTSGDYFFYDSQAYKSITGLKEVVKDRLTSADSMFWHSVSLIEIPSFDTSNVTNAKEMFFWCESLITIPEFNFSNVTNAYRLVTSSFNIRNIGGFIGLKVSLDFSQQSNLTHDSIMNIINKAADVSANPQTLTFGSTNLAKITDEEKAVATSKGWTLA